MGQDLNISNVGMVESLISRVFFGGVIGTLGFNQMCQLGLGPLDLTRIPMVFDPTELTPEKWTTS